MSTYRLYGVLGALVALGVAGSAHAVSVTLGWDPEAVDGFRLYYVKD